MPSDPIEFFEQIAPYAGGKDYSHQDRQRDFRAVLMEGSAPPEQCMRVLHEIFSQTFLYRNPVMRGENDVTYMRLGRQDLGRWLLMTLMAPPPEQPEATQSQE